jgi:hypothetical protein
MKQIVGRNRVANRTIQNGKKIGGLLGITRKIHRFTSQLRTASAGKNRPVFVLPLPDIPADERQAYGYLVFPRIPRMKICIIIFFDSKRRVALRRVAGYGILRDAEEPSKEQLYYL